MTQIRLICMGLTLCLLLFGRIVVAQLHSTPINHLDYHHVSRVDIQQTGDSSLHTSLKPYDTRSWTRVHESLIFKDPVLKSFYKNGLDFYQLASPGIEFRINPVINFQYSKEENIAGSRYINTRGAELKGTIDRKIGYYVMVTDNQIEFPSDVQDLIAESDAVPREGFYKEFKDSAGVDFITTRAYINFPISKHIKVNFGHDRHFIGNGHRSLLLSDHSSPYFFLRLNTKVWKLNYQNLFVELNGQIPRSFGDTLRPKKFAAFHHLSLNLTRNLNIGIFEGVVFARNNTYELQYLNPIIFYRSVEQSIGSPDNAFIGFDAKYNLLKRFSLYGQLIIDEFNFQEIRGDSSGWWGNKFGYQLGLKYVNVGGLEGLDLQGEFNSVRPYTYTHKDGRANYTHYNQPLAHPLGANFDEYIVLLQYQANPKIRFQGKYIMAIKGIDEGARWQEWVDSTSTNWGGNIFLPYTTREQEYGNSIGQGSSAKIHILEFGFSYQWKYNIFWDLLYRNRFYSNPLGPNANSSYVGFGLRMNIAERRMDY